jgi:flagellar basal body-associated protein FliL
MRKNSRFGIVLNLCLVLGIAAPLTMMSRPAFANEDGGEGAPKPGDVTMFVKLNPINVPIIRKNGTTSILAIDIVAECKDEKAKEKVEAAKPRLRDSFIRALYGNIEVNKLVREDGALDMERVKQRLIQGSLYVLKEPAITDILFNGVSHRAF